MKPKIKTKPLRILDFDIETVAAGFADPNWVPQRVTCIAWSWIGKREVKFATRLEGPVEMFERFWEDLIQADMVCGHNLLRFDLPVLNADLIRVGMEQLFPILVQDTMKLPKTKGLKKGQDNIAQMLEVRNRKRSMDWQAWDDAYEWDLLIAGGRPTWEKVIERCVTDVRQHKTMRKRMLEEGILKPPVMWRP